MHGYEYLKNFLHEEGYKIQDEEDAHFSFKYQGTFFVAFKNESPYVQIIVPCNTESVPRDLLLETCNAFNSNKFVMKFIVMDKGTWVSYELAPNEATSTQEWQAIVEGLNEASDEFFRVLKERME